MKKALLFIIVAAILLVGVVSALQGQTLPVDSRRKEMQFHRSYSLGLYSPSADTLYNRITLPSRTMEVTITAETGAIQVAVDSTYVTTSAFPKNYVTIATGTTLKLPTYRAQYLWIRRAVAGTASKAHVVFLKM